jgi:hypothetical protein
VSKRLLIAKGNTFDDEFELYRVKETVELESYYILELQRRMPEGQLEHCDQIELDPSAALKIVAALADDLQEFVEGIKDSLEVHS